MHGLMDTIRKLYLCDDIPWVIGYSGGKDSTATLQLVWLALSELPKDQLKKQVHIINTDTMVESPVISKWVQTSLKTMDDAAEEQGLPFVTHRLTPTIDNTFWVNFIGRGYPFPRKKLRWCTDRLKIQPVNNFVKEKIAEHGEIIMVIGTRKAESARRAKTMAYYEKKRVRELLSPKNIIDSYTQPFYGLVKFAREEPETVQQMFMDLYSDDGGNVKISDFCSSLYNLNFKTNLLTPI